MQIHRVSYKTAIYASIFLAATLISVAQDYPDSTADEFLESISFYENGWIQFRPGSEIAPSELFTTHKSFFGLGADDEMELVAEESYESDYGRYIYQQKYQEKIVKGAEYLVHIENGYVVRMNGKILSGLELNVSPTLTESAALASALEAIGADEYAWEDFELPDETIIPGDALIRDSIVFVGMGLDSILIDDDSLLAVGYVIVDGDSLFIGADSILVYPDSLFIQIPGAPYPTGTLQITVNSFESAFASENMALAYHFTIAAREPLETHEVYVDAQNGQVLIKQSIERYSTGDCNPTTYNGNQNLTTKWTGWPPWKRFILGDDNRKFKTRRYQTIRPFALEEVRAYNNHFAKEKWKKAPASAHWAVQKAWDYFKYTHGRNGHTGGSGREIRVYLYDRDEDDCGASYQTTAYKGYDEIRIGQKQGCNEPVALDLLAHEFTHGVTSYSVPGGGFLYAGESGALDESFADIFAVMVEFEVEGSSGNWTIAEDMNLASSKQRSLSNPNGSGGNGLTYGQPSYYEQTNYWYFGADQDAYVHINSGVQNHWFYLLSQGGALNGYTVSGIGKDKAAAIAYRNLTRYMQYNSNYADAKNGSIYAAIDLYGVCSNEVLQTINAWNAVNVHASGGILYYHTVNCSALNTAHSMGKLYSAYAVGNLTASCTIANNKRTVFVAGNKINLTAGFRTGGTNGNYFHAYISDCLGAVLKTGETPGGDISGDSDLPVQLDVPSNGSNVIVYPNPTAGVFTIQLNPTQAGTTERQNRNIEVTDILGNKVVHIANVKDESIHIDISDRPAGMYLVHIRSSQGHSTIRLVKQ